MAASIGGVTWRTRNITRRDEQVGPVHECPDANPDRRHANAVEEERWGDGSNDRNERTKAKRFNNTSPPSTSNEDSSYHRQFVFDNAGNWDWFKSGSDPNTPYVPNALNLYDSINDPNAPGTPVESFTYDTDQNLTEDGSFEYAYDAENRLVEVVPAEDDPNNLTADDKKLVFTYDYLNRRVRKVVYAWDPNEGESGDWSATAELDLRFIYHERLLLLELDGLDSNAKVRKHVWGPGSDGRLGGLNSLLAIRDVDSSTNYVCFNNGTGSVAQLLDRSDGSVDAKYVYDTRADTVRNTGTYAADNPLRFRAMYFDSEFDYADTTCDGLYCAVPGGFYSPRLHRRIVKNATAPQIRSRIAMDSGSFLVDARERPPRPGPAAAHIWIDRCNCWRCNSVTYLVCADAGTGMPYEEDEARAQVNAAWNPMGQSPPGTCTGFCLDPFTNVIGLLNGNPDPGPGALVPCVSGINVSGERFQFL